MIEGSECNPKLQGSRSKEADQPVLLQFRPLHHQGVETFCLPLQPIGTINRPLEVVHLDAAGKENAPQVTSTRNSWQATEAWDGCGHDEVMSDRGATETRAESRAMVLVPR